MQLMFLLVVLLIFLAVILGMGAITYVTVRGIGRLFSGIKVSTSLPRQVARSMKESRQYGREIMKIAEQYPSGPMRDRLNLTIKPVGEWLASLDKLEQSLDKLYGQRNLTRELAQTKFDIQTLRREMLTAGAKELIYLRKLLESKKQHYAVLKELKTFQTQAELKIHQIASDLGTAHAEMLLLVARGDFNENRMHRLDENLQDNLSSMRDMLSAMDEMDYREVSSF